MMTCEHFWGMMQNKGWISFESIHWNEKWTKFLNSYVSFATDIYKIQKPLCVLMLSNLQVVRQERIAKLNGSTFMLNNMKNITSEHICYWWNAINLSLMKTTEQWSGNKWSLSYPDFSFHWKENDIILTKDLIKDFI